MSMIPNTTPTECFVLVSTDDETDCHIVRELDEDIQTQIDIQAVEVEGPFSSFASARRFIQSHRAVEW